MRVHIIAIGGRIMHTLAILLQDKGYQISGSDDEIYEPSRTRLADANLLPDQMGWHPSRIMENIDLVILGMHAKVNNPELLAALELGIKVVSYPEFIYGHSIGKQRIVIAGSHGKTTTTAMIMHVLKYRNISFDYLIGAESKGFDKMIRLSDAPLIILEGDEYLSSAIDPRPKMQHYHPHISVITGISWDHVNVFKSEEEYANLFRNFLEAHQQDAKVFIFEEEGPLKEIRDEYRSRMELVPYSALTRLEKSIVEFDQKRYRIRVFGRHNRSNMMAALKVCQEIGITAPDFFAAISTFTGASRRMESLVESDNVIAYRDFAHAPSKVRATIQALKEHFSERKLIAFLELHTYSSLNKNFLPQYQGALDAADEAYVYYSKHTLSIKKLPDLQKADIFEGFANAQLIVIDNPEELRRSIEQISIENCVIVFMSSGNFDKIDMKGILIDKI